jgi:hypothetical protein
VPLVLRGLLYLKVEAGMKKYKLIIDCEPCEEEEVEVEDIYTDELMDHVWLDTGEMVLQLPDELLPYLQDSEILGIA